MRRGRLVTLLSLMLVAVMLAGCSSVPTAPAVDEEPVTIRVAGGWADCRALDEAATAFTKEYPNCTITYEYLQDYYNALEKRMTGDAQIDLFFTTNIQQGFIMQPYALDLYELEELDLSDTFDGLIENFIYREEGVAKPKLLSVPLGAEMRGMYVNITLLNSLGLEMPTDQASLLSACETLKQNGYIPFHGNPGMFPQLLVYPWMCNLIANAEDPQSLYDRVNSREPGVSEIFTEPLRFVYTLIENDYYDYKRAQTELGLFLDATDEAYSRDFLNIKSVNDVWVKEDDLGKVAFMPSTLSLQASLDKAKNDYHSQIEYAFIPAPVGPDGGYAYLSPAHGIAINKDSANADWAIRFLDFLFQAENNKAFAEAFDVVPNTKEAFSYISNLYAVPDERISHLGQVTFDYGFYSLIQPVIVDIAKANNPKYMKDDGAGNLSLFPFEYYMDALENTFQQE